MHGIRALLRLTSLFSQKEIVLEHGNDLLVQCKYTHDQAMLAALMNTADG